MFIPCDSAFTLSDIYHKEIIKYVHKDSASKMPISIIYHYLHTK